MAKKRRPLRQKDVARTAEAQHHNGRHWQAATIIHPTPLPGLPRRVAMAHAKHTISPPVPVRQRPTLDERFQALPPELRAHIFSLILVTPVKWELTHNPLCPLRHCRAEDNVQPHQDLTGNFCASCHGPHWRMRALVASGMLPPSWDNPWRSQWAPPKLNPYLCSDCWDVSHRPNPFPRVRDLRCLCARRENLQVLLVCKQWYAEASHTLWTRNTFAFEDSQSFSNLVTHLSPRSRDLISRVSIMAYRPTDREAFSTVTEFNTGWEANNKLKQIWPSLRQLPSLSYLELDARFLTNEYTLTPMLRLGLRNLRQVCFSQRRPLPPVIDRPSECAYIFLEFRDAILLVGGFAGEVARVIKGERLKYLKTSRELRRALKRETMEQFAGQRFRLADPRDALDLFDEDTVDRLWRMDSDGFWSYVKREPIYLRRGRWRTWTRRPVDLLREEMWERDEDGKECWEVFAGELERFYEMGEYFASLDEEENPEVFLSSIRLWD